MSPLEAPLIAAYSLVVTAWIVLHLVLRVHQRKLHLLGKQSPQLQSDDPPLVSVLVPARDEQDTIETCLESVLAQTYPNLEVVVIDDRSTDQTAHRVQSLGARDERVRLLRITRLPPGWTGKAYALYEGAKLARGEFLLFIDADTRHEPESLAVALYYAHQHRADCVSLLPRLLNRSFWERVISPLAGSLLMSFYPLPRVNQSKHRHVAFANGQYILIRRQVYEAIGGHLAVRDKFVEDIHLARHVKGQGYRLKVALGTGLLSTRMYTGLGEQVRGWSRILYAAVDGRPWKLLVTIGFTCLMSVSAYMILAVFGLEHAGGHRSALPPILFGMNAIHLILMLWFVRRLYRLSGTDRRYLAFHWLGLLVTLYIQILALILCLTHRVTWRGTAYRRLVPSSEPVPNEATQSGRRR